MQSSIKIYSKPTLISTVSLYFAFLLLSIFLPSLIHNQAITGSLINAILLIATITLGTSQAMTVGLLPSAVALSQGLLPIALAPIVPFIMLANALYVLVFASLKDRNFAQAVVLASVSKFALLYFVSQQLLASLLPSQFLTRASVMFSWPQLVTALAGGLIANLILRVMGQKNSTDK